MSLEQLANHAILCEILCGIYMNAFELSFIRRIWIRNLIIVKHMIFWHYFKYFSGELAISIDITPHIIAGLSILLYNFISYYYIETSYERYLYRREKESAESRLEVIISGFPDGILILSEDFKIEYVNENFLALMFSNKDELLDILSSINYCDGKKYSQLTESNSLFEDMEAMFNCELRDQVMLGISKYEGNSIE